VDSIKLKNINHFVISTLVKSTFVKYLLNMFKPTKGGAVETVTEGIKGGGKWKK
jgi:hypothetical protein